MSTDLLTQLKALHLYGMRDAWSELSAEMPQHKQVSPQATLSQLINAEIADRQLRSLKYQMKAAKFPIHRDLVKFDWGETALSRQQIEQLSTAGFMDVAHNLILVGGTGTSKTHLATALGVAAIHHGKRIRFFNAVDLVNLLEQEKQLNKTGYLARRLIQIDAVILDELGLSALPGIRWCTPVSLDQPTV